MYSVKLYLLIMLLCVGSCSNKSISNNDIDNFIGQYDSVNFDSVKGIFIAKRSSILSETVYIIDKFGENKPPYFVTFNLSRQIITDINRTLLEQDSIADYLTENEIYSAINTIKKYDFYLLAMDSSENVYMNPFYANAPAYFLRLKIATGDSTVRSGYIFNLYKNNWYLNKGD